MFRAGTMSRTPLGSSHWQPSSVFRSRRLPKPCAKFQHARRRFEIKYASDRFLLVDDYAHHPTEIRATLAAARSTGRNRVLTMFQPHRYTRTKALRQEFGAAFDQADRVVITDVYPASEPPIPGISGQTIADAISAHGHRGVTYQSRFAHVHHDVGNMLASGDLVLSLGAGNIHEQLSILAAELVVAEKLKAIVGEEGEVRLHEPMAKHTTLRVGGPAQFWTEPRTEKAFAELIRFCRRENLPLFVIGRGSNLLVRDGGITGVVVHPCGGEFDDIAVNGNEITAGVGAKLKQVAYAGRDAGIGGLEWMEGIPGEVGGALRMNAGAMGGQTFEHVVSVRVLDAEGNAQTMTPSEMEVHYRHVPTLEKNYAVSAVFRGVPAGKDEIVRKLEESQHKRKTTQPAASSAGCIFKNPDSIPAGKLVGRTRFEKLRDRKSAGLGGAWKFYRQRGRSDRGGNAGVDRENSSDGAGKTRRRITNRSANRRGGRVKEMNALPKKIAVFIRNHGRTDGFEAGLRHDTRATATLDNAGQMLDRPLDRHGLTVRR